MHQRKPGDLVEIAPETSSNKVVVTRIFPNNTLAESHVMTGSILAVWLECRPVDLTVDWEKLDIVLWNSRPHAILRGIIHDRDI
jgi:hypothetical protein